MSEHSPSGGPGLPGSSAGRRPGSPHSSTPAPPQEQRPVLSQPRADTPPPAASGAAPPRERASSTRASANPADGVGDEGKTSKSRGRRRGSRRGRRGASDADPGATVAESESRGSPSESDVGNGDGSEERPKRRRRGGRRRSRTSRTETGAENAPESAEEEGGQDEGSSGTTTRKSRTRRVRSRRSSGASDEADAAETSSGEAIDDERKSGRKRSRKRGSRGGRGRGKKLAAAVGIEAIPGEDDDLPELVDLPEEAVLVEDAPARGKARTSKASKKRTAKKKSRRSRSSKREEEESDAPPAAPKKRIILVNAGDPEETRVAVVEDGRIADLQMTVKKHVSYVNDIYRGRIVNIESAIGAAFVDFGQGRNGFLHVSDILPSYGEPDWKLENLLSAASEHVSVEEADEDSEDDDGPAEETKGKGSEGKRRGAKGRSKRVRVPIDKLIKKGQMVAVQITKDAIGDKGPTLSTFVSIPGRYLVLMPSLERTGVSRKIDDDKERRRLKRILSSLEIPDGMGVIVRTAGIGKTKTELKRDLEYLLLAWDDFSRRLKSGRNPAPLYQESDVAIRTMRDLFTAETSSVIVDDEEVHGRMVEFTEKLMPEHVERIVRHDGPRPLFQSHGVEQDFEKIFSRRVELPSGGSIVLDQTEALVAVDVNSGRTREAGAEFEDIALKTNLEAVPEIARQMRLRDLGGIIVLDFIDMMKAASRRSVEKAVRDALKTDRARSKIGRISQFGLLELTRQRLGPGLNKLVYDTCIRCRGSGRRRNASSRAQAILRRLGASLALKGFTSVEVRAHPDVIEYLKKELKSDLARLEETSGRSLVLTEVPDQVEDSVLHYLRADGREVRPGGRRRR